MPNDKPSIHYKYYIGIGFLLIAIISSYFIFNNKKTINNTSTAAPIEISKEESGTNFFEYEFDSANQINTTDLFNVTDRKDKIIKLEAERAQLQQDLSSYQEQFNKYNNRFIVLNKKKNNENKEKYAALINATKTEISKIDKQLYFLKQ